MKLVRQLDHLDPALRGGAVTIGNFDGVHLGHARIVQRLIQMADRIGGPAVVFTFDPHPARIMRPNQAPPPLSWTERKAELFAKLGVDAMLVYPTDKELLSLTPEAFFERIVLNSLDARAMVEGPNFFFGRDRAGNVDKLQRLCAEADLVLEIVQPLKDGDEYISSSRVRRLIRRGDVGEARRLLTEAYRIRGVVTQGAARGAKIGFPTANLNRIDTLIPAQGVYAARGLVGETAWPAAVNIGPNPTFGEHALKVEAHLVGFQGALYGKSLELDFLARLRDIRPFDSVEHLQQQLAEDVRVTRQIVLSE